MYIELKPGKARNSSNQEPDSVRLSIVRTKSGSNKINIYIGSKVARSCGLCANDRVALMYDEANPRRWFIKKAGGQGFKVAPVLTSSGIETGVYRIQLTWKKFSTREQDLSTHNIQFYYSDGGIKIDLDSGN